jgi:hypothetical protein
MISYGVPCIFISQGNVADEWNSLEKWTGIAHILEFVFSIVSNVLRQTLSLLLPVQPIIVPHSEKAHYDPVKNSVSMLQYGRLMRHTKEKGIP